MQYTIGQAAQQLNLAPSTLRYYDKEGLLPFVDRSSGGIRLFREEDMGWLNLIECLKKTGMPLKDIKKYIDWVQQGDSTIEQRRALFYERKKVVEEQIAQMQRTLDTIRYKCWFYDVAAEEGSMEAPKRMTEQELPEDIRAIKTRISIG